MSRKDVLGASAAQSLLGARKRTAGSPPEPETSSTPAKKTAAKKAAKKTATKKKTGAKKTGAKKKTAARKPTTVDLSGAGDDLLDALPTAKVASGSDRKVKLQPKLYVRLVKICAPFGDRRSPENRREKLVSPGKLASVATDALLQAHGQELHEFAAAAGRQTVEPSGILTVGTYVDGEPDPAAPQTPWVRLAETTWARLTRLTDQARNIRDDQGRKLITAEAIVNESVARWLDANEARWIAAAKDHT